MGMGAIHIIMSRVKTFSLLYLKVDGNFVASLVYWLGSYKEWGPRLSRLSERKLEIPMYSSELDWYGAHTYYVWWKTFSLLYSKVDGNSAAGQQQVLGIGWGPSREWGPHLDRLLQQNI
jgi:hypothetical protein